MIVAMKSLKFFRTLCCSALAVLAVACYDDDRLWDELTDVRNEMTELKSRLDSLEQEVAENVTALQSMISVGSIQSWVYNAETGKGVITLMDGTKITVNQEIKGYSIITVDKDEDGNYFWALNSDGENLPLLINNKKVPVTVTPALKISSDNEWMISVDGGQTWVKTGISYYAEEDSDTEVSASVFESAKVDGDNLILTLVGGEEIKVTIVGEAVFKAAEEALWFSRANMQKSVALEMNNVKAFTITEKPEGWKAVIEESYLFVTSPANFSYSPSEGTIKVFVLFDNGAQPEIMQLDVAYEPMFSLSHANGVVSVKLSEKTGEDFTGYLLTSWIKEEYSAKAVADYLNANHESLKVYTGSQIYNLEDIIEDYDNLNKYVVAAVPYLPATQVNQGTLSYKVDDIISIETISEDAGWKIKNVSFDSADLLAVMSVPEYYGGFSSKEVWETRGKADVLELLKAGNMTPFDVIKFDGPANAFPDGEINEAINPNTEYVVWYVPVNADGEYTLESFVEYPFTTPDVVADESVAAPEYVVRDVTSAGFTADVTPSANAYKTYTAIVKSIVISEMSEIELVRYLIHANHYTEDSEINTVTTASFDPSDEVYLLAVSVKEDGRYGKVVKDKIALKDLEFTNEIGVSVTGVEYDELGNATLTLSYKGSPATITYMAVEWTFYEGETLRNLLAKKQLGDAQTAVISEIGNKLTISGLAVGSEHTFYAVVTDAQGRHSEEVCCDFTFVPTLQIEYVLAKNSNYDFGKPEITGTLTKTGETFDIYNMNVKMPAECMKYWVLCASSEYFTGDAYIDTDKMVTMHFEAIGETVHESSATLRYEYVTKSSRIYMVWKDVNGKYHVVYEFNPNKK